MTLLWTLLWTMVLVGAVSALATPAGAADAAAPTVVRIGMASVGVGGTPCVGGTVIGYAQATGLLEREFQADGIRIQWIFHKGAGPAVNEGIAAGGLDLAWQGDLPALIGRSAGLPTRLLMAASRGGNAYLAVPVGSPAKSLHDLVGKRVVLFRGTAPQLAIDRILNTEGLSERDFQTISLDTASGLTALTDGDVDAMWGSYLFFEMRDRGLIRFVFSTQDPPVAPDRPWATSQSGLLVTDDFATRYPGIVQRIVNVLVRADVWAADPAHAQELYQVWSKSGTPAAHFQEDFQKVPPLRRLSPLLDADFLGQLAVSMQQAQSFHLIRGLVALDAWCDRSFLDHALALLPQPTPWAH